MFSLSQYRMSLEDTLGLTRTSGEWELCRRADGEPWYALGNTAIVFRIRHDGRIRALRCYRRPMRHLREIYGERLLERELFLFTGPDCGVWVDVVMDDWIEGETLRHVLFEAVRNRDADRLTQLSLAFDRLSAELLSDDRAHGDLKPENILVDTADKLHPIDFDAAYLPAFAGERSPELGTAAYQHPARTADDFHAALDDYPAVLIATALHALRVAPELLDRYGERDGLLFDPPHIAEDEALREVLALFERRGWAAQYRLAESLYAPTLHLPQAAMLLEAAHAEVIRNIQPKEEMNHHTAPKSTEMTEIPELFVEGGRWGYRLGTETVVPPLYDCGFDFTEGLAAVRLNTTWHYIDPTGRPVITCPDCEAVKPFHEGRAVVIRHGERLCIDRTGRIAEEKNKPIKTRNQNARTPFDETPAFFTDSRTCTMRNRKSRCAATDFSRFGLQRRGHRRKRSAPHLPVPLREPLGQTRRHSACGYVLRVCEKRILAQTDRPGSDRRSGRHIRSARPRRRPLQTDAGLHLDIGQTTSHPTGAVRHGETASQINRRRTQYFTKNDV